MFLNVEFKNKKQAKNESKNRNSLRLYNRIQEICAV